MNDIKAPIPRGPSPEPHKLDKQPPELPVEPPTAPVEPETGSTTDWLPKPSQLVKGIRRKGLKWVWICIGVFLLLMAALAGGAYWWYVDNLQAKADSSSHVAFKVESGESVDQVSSRLEQQGLIRSALAMQIYMKFNGKTDIKTGSYLFAAAQTPAELAQWLVDGRIDTFKVTILPGQTLTKIKNRLIKDGFAEADVKAAFAKDYDHEIFRDKPAKAGLEGYIYPETYFVGSDTTVEQLLVHAFDEFQKQVAAKDIVNKLKARGFDLHEGIILSSIIEREVRSDSDRRQVSQIFQKRLREGMPLGADATYHYAAEIMGVAPSTTLKSPYNTRLHTGLTPGPIANFNFSALEAVVNPAAGSYLYFVSGDDGNTYYAHTFAEHEQNIAKYCHDLCSRP